ncbi:MAG: alpha/beta fold hydrolase [Oceanobacter sp.]
MNDAAGMQQQSRHRLNVSLGDGTCVQANLTLPERRRPAGVIQVLHGMAEHAGRYEYFIQQLLIHGYAVVIHNHRGHGERTPLGYFSEPDHCGHNGWHWVVDDALRVQNAFRSTLEKTYGELPFILFGHSLGSFIARDMARTCGDKLDALILSGTNSQPDLMYKVGLKVTEWLSKLQSPEQPSELLNWLVFGRYNSHIHAPRTRFDWLSRDTQIVDQYLADPLCGKLHSLQFWSDFFAALIRVDSKEAIDQIPKDLPVFMMSGDDDPVGRYGAGVHRLENLLHETGHDFVSNWLYEARRHELLNETNRDAVILDLLDWLDNNRKSRISSS